MKLNQAKRFEADTREMLQDLYQVVARKYVTAASEVLQENARLLIEEPACGLQNVPLKNICSISVPGSDNSWEKMVNSAYCCSDCEKINVSADGYISAVKSYREVINICVLKL